MKTHCYDYWIRVLIYKDEDEFVAHALEMDILGYGRTEEQAKKELEKLIENQLSFAACMEKATVLFPAPHELFDRWYKAKEAQLKGKPASEKAFGLLGKPVVLVYSQDELKKLRAAKKRDFSRTENLAVA